MGKKKHNNQTIESLEDTSVHNMLLKAVCLRSASLAVHSNVIEGLRKFHELQNPRITINQLCIIAHPNLLVNSR